MAWIYYSKPSKKLTTMNNNNEKAYKGCGVVILALFILSLVINVWLIKRGQVESEPQVVIEHDTTINKPVTAD